MQIVPKEEPWLKQFFFPMSYQILALHPLWSKINQVDAPNSLNILLSSDGTLPKFLPTLTTLPALALRSLITNFDLSSEIRGL